MGMQETSQQIAQQERYQRFWMAMVGLSLLLVMGVFCFIGSQIITPEPREIAAGQVDTYVDNVPQRLAVEKLAISDWVERRMKVSEDIIFVMRDGDGVWYALLGVDMRTGCFLHWEEQDSLYMSPSDPNCLEARYTPDGRFVDSLPSSDAPKPMARLEVEIREGEVIVLDKLLRAEE
jgi:Rieske Fe-S protein